MILLWRKTNVFSRLMSILVNNVSDTIINIFMIVAMVVGFFQLRHLKIDHLEVSETDISFDDFWISFNWNYCYILGPSYKRNLKQTILIIYLNLRTFKSFSKFSTFNSTFKPLKSFGHFQGWRMGEREGKTMSKLFLKRLAKKSSSFFAKMKYNKNEMTTLSSKKYRLNE